MASRERRTRGHADVLGIVTDAGQHIHLSREITVSLFVLVVIIFIVLAAASLVWWGISRMALPEPVKTVVLVIFGLICLLVIYHFVVGGGINVSLK